MKRKQVLALLIAAAMTANMTMPAFAATAPVSGSIFWGSEEAVAITEDDLAAAMAAAVKGTDAVSEGAEKEETVYVFTDANGKQKSMTVSNWLKNKDGADKLYDNSILQNIENVKGDEPFTQNGDILTWNAGGNDIYYQGTTDKAAPITQKITYYLDGKEVSPEDLAGKSGKVKIHIDYDNSEKYSDVFVPFTTMTGIIFSNDNVKNVEIDNGSVISEGKNTVVVGMAFPGLSDSLQSAKDDAEHLLDETEASQKSKDRVRDLEIPDSVEITMDATDFKMSTCMTMVFSGLFDDDEEMDEDHDSFLKDMDEKIADLETDGNDLAEGAGKLSDGIGEAADGSNELSDGAGELADGIKKYMSGVYEVNDGAEQLADGTDTLVNGLPQLTDGLGDYTDGVAQIDAGLGSLMGGMPELKNGTSALSGGLEAYGAGVNSITEGLAALNGGAQQLQDHSEALNGGLEKLAEGTGALQTGLNQYTAGVSKAKAGTAQMLDEKEGIPALLKGAEELKTGVEQYTGSVSEAAEKIGNGADTIQSALTDAQEDIGLIGEAGKNLGDLEAAAENIRGGISGVREAVDNQIIPGITKIENNAAAIEKDDEIVGSAASAGKDDALGSVETVDSENYKVDGGGYMISADDYSVSVDVQEIGDNVYNAVLNSLPEDMVDREQIASDARDEAMGAAGQAMSDANNSIKDIVDDANTNISTLAGTANQNIENIAGDANISIENAAESAAESAAWKAAQSVNDEKLSVIASNAESIKTGTGGVSESLGKLEEGSGAVKDSIHAANLLMGDLGEKLEKVSGGFSVLSDGANALAEASSALQDGSGKLEEGVVKLQTGTTQLQAGVSNLDAGLGELVSNNEALNTGAAELYNGITYVPEEGSDEQPGLQAGLAAYTAGVADLNAGLKEAYDGAKALNGNTAALVQGAKKLDAGAQALSAGASRLKSGTSQLAANSSKLASGAAALASGASQLDDGMSKLASGTQTLADNSGKLTDGASQLSEGAAKLAEGMSEISSGSLELKDGCVKLNEEGVRKLSDLYKTDVKSIDNRISMLRDAAKAYRTFSGTANPDKTRVKFIYKTDSIEKKD